MCVDHVQFWNSTGWRHHQTQSRTMVVIYSPSSLNFRIQQTRTFIRGYDQSLYIYLNNSNGTNKRESTFSLKDWQEWSKLSLNDHHHFGVLPGYPWKRQIPLCFLPQRFTYHRRHLQNRKRADSILYWQKLFHALPRRFFSPSSPCVLVAKKPEFQKQRTFSKIYLSYFCSE